jgi:hypothetical protein
VTEPSGIYCTRMLDIRHLSARTVRTATVLVAIYVSATAVGVGQTMPKACSAYASIPLPVDAESVPAPKASPTCASFRFYRGIGRPIDYSKARACAWQERGAQLANEGQNPQEPIAWFVGGSLILADIYFNGNGVKADVPLAMRFACESEEGMAELALPEIEKRSSTTTPHHQFEFCDYAASTFAINFCGAYTSQVEDEHRGRYYSLLKRSMTPAQQAAFERLLAAESTFVTTHASEVYQGGTIRGIRTMGSENILKDLFRAEIAHFEQKKWPSLTQAQIAGADDLLDQEYEKKLGQLKIQSKDEIDDGAVTAENLLKVEETWKSYRNAWVVFARLRYPAAAETIRAEVTLDRYRFVKTI